MELSLIYEIVGYVASALVAVSLLMTSILRLRIINLIGAIVFVVYGVLIVAYPIVLTNAIIVCINVYQLYKLSRVEDDFSLLHVDAESSYLKQFVAFYYDDISKIYPEFENNPLHASEANLVVFVLRNMLPVGVFIAKKGDSNRAVVKLDYVVPGYRDFKVGAYLHRQQQMFAQQGIQQLISYPGNDMHQSYLERMGYERDFRTSDRVLYQMTVNTNQNPSS